MRITRIHANLLLAAAAWTIWVWSVRIWNILGDPHPFGFKLVHGLLAIVSVGFGVIIGVIGWRLRRQVGQSPDRPADRGGDTASATRT